MGPIERIMACLEGREIDRIPTFCAMLEDRTFNEVLGKPPIPQETLFSNFVSTYALERWGRMLTKPIFQPLLNKAMEKRIRAAVELGFDATWGMYEETFIVKDSKTLILFSGSIYDLQPDGFGNMTYMYREPGITSRDKFESWPYWPDPDEVAHRAYKFYKKMVSKYGDKICLFGQASAYGIQETILWSLGFERMALWIRKEPEIISRFIKMNEELCLKTTIAMLDAGVPVILQSDDFAFKTGPMMNPLMIDELFGEPYKKIISLVHERGAKYILHSCGDNTLLFDTFIKWDVDGLHAYENTSNVDIYQEKKIHGDMVTIIGGVGVDYLLTDRSRDEEVKNHVKNLIKNLAPGGKFILGPVHSLSSIPAHKLKVMLDAAHAYGKYPLAKQ